ncbi:MFS transporter [Janibacter corallicola]|uniref:MFS transporter n=1 Tax=Janibacter corallicola TaxID=415212 RepID=UPI000829FE77|nr:MFS transporter [Janibacter corallicola]
MTVVPQLVAPAHLQQANAVMAFARRGSMVLGPAIAGVLVATTGPGWAIMADAATFLLATLALTRVRLPPSPPATGSEDVSSSLRRLREGWTQVRSRTWLWVIIAAKAWGPAAGDWWSVPSPPGQSG